MAVTRTQTQATWDTGSASKTVSAATIAWSDAFTIDDTTVLMSVQVSADNAGTPASGDTAKFLIAWSNGDILGDTGDDYDTDEHAQTLITLDTYATNTPGEDPARRTPPAFQPAGKKCKIGVYCPNAATRNMVVRARIDEQRVA